MHAYGDDRVEPGAAGTLFLTATSSKGWRGRSAAVATRRAAHPGTAVEWNGVVYEVTDARPLPSGEVLYSLAPWDGAQAIRSLERYDPAAEAARSRERLGRTNAIRKRRAAILLSPLLGHLPGEVQERMESEFGAPATKMTVASALPLFVLGVLGTFGAFAASTSVVGGSHEPLPVLPLPLSLYLTFESYFRLSSVATQSRAMGSIPGTLLYELWRRVRT